MMSKRRVLNRRIGSAFFPIVGPNIIFILVLWQGYVKLGLNGLYNSIPALGLLFLIENSLPAYVIYMIFRYKICIDETGVWATPLDQRGPLTQMRFDEVARVDLKPNSDLQKFENARAIRSMIVLYRKGWDGYELFALDPSRTNLNQFKELVRLIHDRCPGTFTENALRYLNSPKLMTPREDRYGEFIW